jgi:glycosyltransferase involved in cell wall biosynthesis
VSERQPQHSLRIAVLSRHFVRHLGGAENYAVSLVEQMAGQHQITVFCQEHGDPIPGVTYQRMRWGFKRPRWLNQWAYACWTGWMTRQGFDVVHSHENVFHGQVHTVHVKPVRHNLFHQAQGAQRVWTWLKILLSPRLQAYLLLERLRFSRRAHRVIIAASAPLAHVLSHSFSLWPGQLQELPPGVNIPLSHTPHELQHLKQQARESLGLPHQAYLLLMIGHDFRKKGLETVLKALQRLSADHHLVVVGQPAQIPQWRALIETLGLSARVHFLGILKQTTTAYEACDCLVHATLEDVFPMVTLEAMAHGLPLVVSPAPFCLSSELLTHQQQALILPSPQDDAALARDIQRLQSDPELRERLVRQGRAFAQTYAWAHLAQRQLSLYRLAIQGVEPPHHA